MTTSQTATPEPFATGISATGTVPETPGPSAVGLTAANPPVSLETSCANPGLLLFAADPPITAGTATGKPLF